ncbi:MAG: T9SS type A sorting domain-containing protein [Ignavibacteriales bacterium]|nr:T9SS type A sorting domain-containing protein [Ignavibacteriales bacterium]
MRGGDPELNDPTNQSDVYNYLNGLTRIGNIIDPCYFTIGSVNGGVNCAEVNPYLWFSGDPVANIGWINTSEGDLRNIISSGRFTLEVNRPIDIWVGYIVGQGTSALNSVTVTRNYVQNAQAYFNNNFTNGTVSDVDDFSIVTGYNLYQNFPNPFNPSTKIIWQSPVAGHQTLKVFDVLGNEVATLVDEVKPAGIYEVNFDASALSSGVYFYRLTAGSFIQTKKMILSK